MSKYYNLQSKKIYSYNESIYLDIMENCFQLSTPNFQWFSSDPLNVRPLSSSVALQPSWTLATLMSPRYVARSCAATLQLISPPIERPSLLHKCPIVVGAAEASVHRLIKCSIAQILSLYGESCVVSM